MSTNVSSLGSIRTRESVHTGPGTLEFSAAAPAADTARRRLLPLWMTSDRLRTAALRERDGAPACAVHKIVTTDPSARERL